MKKTILVNTALVLVSLGMTFFLLEFIVFRFLLIAPDMPTLYFSDGIIKYMPNQQGIYRVKNEITSRFDINANGWNSSHAAYAEENVSHKYRIAIIGDSYVEALHVDFDKSLAEQLERYLGIEQYEVFRFGISGAPMSQYLHVLRHEVGKYHPNLVIIVLIHNDFNESYEYVRGVYANSFLKLDIHDGIVADEIPPVEFQAPWYRVIRDCSATWKYLAYRQQVRFNALKNLILDNQREQETYQANVPVSMVQRNEYENTLATDYIFREMKHEINNIGADLIIAMDGDRQAIYQNKNTAQLYETGVLHLNNIAKSSADKHNIRFIDLHPIFENAYHKNHIKFEFQCNYHWNTYGHKIAAHAIFQYMKERNM